MISRRKSFIKDVCEKIKSPGLSWIFIDNLNENISNDVISDFHKDILEALDNISIGKSMTLPNRTKLSHLPVFVALDKLPSGANALYNLGYRPSWDSPILKDEKYEVKFILPDKKAVSFLTGPNGEFSVYTLWLEMRIICAQKSEHRSLGDIKQSSAQPIFQGQKAKK